MNAVKYLGIVVAAGGVAAAASSGCSSPPISTDVREEATSITIPQAMAYPGETRGQIVIWGGRIVNVVNTTNGSSVYIIGLPVDPDGKPLAKESSPGRFIAVSPGFLDPRQLPHGRRITVAGLLNGFLPEGLGKVNYTYPVLEINELHVWPAKPGEDHPEPDYYNYPYYGYNGSGWNYSLSGPR